MDRLQLKIEELIYQHGSLRKVGRVLRVGHERLWKMQMGLIDNPDKALLQKLKLRRVVSYEDV